MKSSRAPAPPDLDTRERILRTASEVWHANSFDGVGTAEICRLAKIHKGSFFHFFPSKDALLLAVLDRHAERVDTMLREGPFRPDVPPLERFARFFRGMASTIRGQIDDAGCARGCPIGNVVLELGTRSAKVRAAARKVFDVMQAVFAEALDEAVDDGDLPADLDTGTRAAAVLALMQGLAVLGKTYGDVGQLERIGARMTALLGVAPQSTRTTRKRAR